MYEQKYEALEATRDKDVKTIREELTAAIAKLDLAEQRYESVTAAQTIMAHESLLAKQRDSLKLELALKSRDAAEEKCVALIMDSKNYVRSIIQYESLLAKNNELSNQLQPTLKYRDISSNKYATFSDNHQNDIIETIMHPEIRSESLSAAKQNQLSRDYITADE
ncbi:hypothetical protein HK100_008032 [Physocladia obscura]|uniref:Uncharacterized protein n=1 Tax=Physocladia obscura TaxID=109957 RepID=A0AAD5T4C0_9FUNG|nr:hypothetical protein HK100_008032 [Physocladia obscura]